MSSSSSYFICLSDKRIMYSIWCIMGTTLTLYVKKRLNNTALEKCWWNFQSFVNPAAHINSNSTAFVQQDRHLKNLYRSLSTFINCITCAYFIYYIVIRLPFYLTILIMLKSRMFTSNVLTIQHSKWQETFILKLPNLLGANR